MGSVYKKISGPSKEKYIYVLSKQLNVSFGSDELKLRHIPTPNVWEDTSLYLDLLFSSKPKPKPRCNCVLCHVFYDAV